MKRLPIISIVLIILISGSCKNSAENELIETNSDVTKKSTGIVIPDESTVDDNVFIILADQLNLRAEPSLDAETVTVLNGGDRVDFVDSHIPWRTKIKHNWIEVTSTEGDKGWVASEFTIREALLAKYARVVELVKRGEMSAAYGKHDDFEAEHPSPDFFLDPKERYLLIKEHSDFTENNYSPFEDEVVLLRNGEGIIGTIIVNTMFSSPAFSASGNYIAYPNGCDVGISDAARIDVIDIRTMKSSWLPDDSFMPYGDAHVYLSEVDKHLYTQSFTPGSDILLYIAGDVKRATTDEKYYPSLLAYDARTGTLTRLLETNYDSITKIDNHSYAKLNEVNPASIPSSIDMDEVKTSEIYRTLASGKPVRIGFGYGDW